MADKRGLGGRNPGIRVYSWFVSGAVIETRSKDAAFPLLCMILFIVPERRRLEQARVAERKPSPAPAAPGTGTTCPLRLFSSLPSLPSPLPSPPSPASGTPRRTFGVFLPFFCLFFLSPPPASRLGIPKARRVGELQEVGVIPLQKAGGSCPLLSRRSWGRRIPERRGRVCVGRPYGGRRQLPGGPVEEGSGWAEPLARCAAPSDGP